MDETTVLLEKAHAGDELARKVLIEKNLGLVHHIVKRFLGRGCDPEDLFQIGSIGLLKAVDKFDLSYEVKFSTYAVPLIAGEIKRFLRDDGMIKVSRTLKEDGMRIRMASEQIAKRTGRDATLSEIREMTGIETDAILLALEANTEVESIYKPVGQGEVSKIQMIERLADQTDMSEQVLNKMLLKQLMQPLDDEEKSLLQLRYFQGKTQTEVAKQLGVSQVQVSRLEKRILKRMYKNYRGEKE